MRRRSEREASEGSVLDLILRAIALAVDPHGFSMVLNAVERSRSEDRIVVEDAGPLLVDPDGGDQGRAALIAMADDLEQAVGAELVDRRRHAA